MTQVQSTVVAFAIVALSLILLVPRITHSTAPVTLLDETVFLTEDDYQRQYTLALNKGDRLEIKVSTNGQPVNLMVTQQHSPAVTVVDQEGQTSYNFEWTVPEDGPYLITLNTDTGSVDATITITKT